MRRFAPLGLLASLSFPACLDRPVVPIEPSSSKFPIETLSVHRVEKVDLLFVVDGSASMSDKQSELGKRIPELISALTTPTVDAVTGKSTRVYDVHVGVISSSLGTLGSSLCRDSPYADDKGWLMPRPGEGTGDGYQLDDAGEPVSTPCPAPVANAPITWVSDRARDPSARYVGEEGAKQLQAASSCAVASVQSKGCGIEATWEAAYHFLVDPAPYKSASVSSAGAIVTAGVDTDLLAQRKAFLRDDSLLAVIVLSDENDFSFMQTADNWRPWFAPRGKMTHGAAGCASIPDFFEPTDPQTLRSKFGCAPCDPSEPSCPKWTGADPDEVNLRGFHQVQRFGRDFLWPVSRYVDAFTVAKPKRPDGTTFVNPVFHGGQRTKDLIIVAGIVGVPELLVANPDLSAKKLGEAEWKKLLSPVLAERDPHMIESIGPRSGLPTFTGDPKVDVHGGERVIGGDDLQYACIGARSSSSGGEDCDTDGWSTNPICTARGEQPYLKAYPGLRHLKILQSLGNSGFVGSICAKSYRPAVRGITDRIRKAVDQQCVKTELSPDATGSVNCMILEALASDSFEGKTRCEELGKGYCTPGSPVCRGGSGSLAPVSPEVAAAQLSSGLRLTVVDADGSARAARAEMKVEDGNVYAVADDHKKHLVCEMLQLAGDAVPTADATACRTSKDPAWKPSVGGGWCYVQDGACAAENAAPGRMRFVGEVEPKSGSQIYTMCAAQ